MAGDWGGTASSATWSTSGNGTFVGANTKTAVYIPGSSDIVNGSVNLIYTTNDPGTTCGPESDTLTLTIYEELQITTQPVNTGVCSSYPADISVAAVGDNLTYQWYYGSGTPVANSGNITGAQTATLHFNSATSADDGVYYVVVSGAAQCSPVNSEEVTLNVDQNINITS